MGVRLGRRVAVLQLLLCSACGLSSTHEPTTGPSLDGPTHLVVDSREFARAPGGLRRAASAFARIACEYDAVEQRRLDFLRDARRLTIPTELHRLTTSERARLHWRILRERAERTRLTILGVTVMPNDGSAISVVVTGVLTTTSGFATVRTFEQLTLSLEPRGRSWVVTNATGAGL
jgi:hypothetical protein